MTGADSTGSVAAGLWLSVMLGGIARQSRFTMEHLVVRYRVKGDKMTRDWGTDIELWDPPQKMRNSNTRSGKGCWGGMMMICGER